jgi:hypothetical protein
MTDKNALNRTAFHAAMGLAFIVTLLVFATPVKHVSANDSDS